MSLILDALNRSEQERRKKADIPDIFVGQPLTEPARNRGVGRYWPVVLPGTLALALLTYYWPTATVEGTSVQDRPAYSQPANREPVGQVSSAAGITTAAKPERVVDLYRDEPSGQGLPAEVEAIHLPWLIELPESVKNSIPSIYYSMHIYAEDEDDNFVVLNNEAARAGDSVGENLRLSAIHAEYIELEFEGNEFRLQALNSWVNL